MTVTVADLPPGEYVVRHHRIDESNSNIKAAWRNIGGDTPWPSPAQWDELRAADELAEFAPPQHVSTSGEPVVQAPCRLLTITSSYLIIKS